MMEEYQMKQTDSSWGSHNDHLGSTSTVALLPNPLLILSYSNPGIGSHLCHVQNIRRVCEGRKKMQT